MRNGVSPPTVKSQIPVSKVAMSCLLVVGFYFLLWTPYWLFFIVTAFGYAPIHWPWFFPLAFSIHTLPYTSSALNWIFYAVLNRQLRQTNSNAVQTVVPCSVVVSRETVLKRQDT